jgi:hypothetical protein
MKANAHPAERAAYERAEKVETDITSEAGEGGYARVYIGLWGSTPEEAIAGRDKLMAFATNRGIVLSPLNNRQDRTINAVLPTGRGLLRPEFPLWMRLIGSH